ncbi:MAG: energy-coupling factor transporter ATPase [Clostridiales bacterium]|nr:energy-coupling factor transporter ATPase [Clostridiales bacterium]
MKQRILETAEPVFTAKNKSKRLQNPAGERQPMKAIDAKDLHHCYEYESGRTPPLDGVSLTIRRGEFAAILGHNGCGKSTLVKHFNVLIPVQQGELTVAGLNAKEKSNLRKIRKSCGMVFQNPDNQFVSSIIKEDIAFGLENYDTPQEKIPEITATVLRTVGMEGYENKSPHMLSGGQKQRIAIAGVLAVEPDIIIFDEATSMLDPEGRREVIETMKRLHDEEHKTVIMISHYVEEAVFADRVFLLNEGKIAAEGTPEEILTNPDLLLQAGLLPPFAVRVFYDLKNAGVILGRCPLTSTELAEEICRLK